MTTLEESTALQMVRAKLEETRDEEVRAKLVAAFALISKKFPPFDPGAKPRKIYECAECGCTEIQSTAWIVMNTGEDAGGDAPTEQVWCPDCNADSEAIESDAACDVLDAFEEQMRANLFEVWPNGGSCESWARSIGPNGQTTIRVTEAEGFALPRSDADLVLIGVYSDEDDGETLEQVGPLALADAAREVERMIEKYARG
jgi:hypothetical protein